MSRVWFTADTHFGHANVIKFCQRPFLTDADRSLMEASSTHERSPWTVSRESVRNHDEQLLDAINSNVQLNDTLWILGDFCLGTYRHAESYRSRIVCRDVRIVWGNHDHRSLSDLFQQCHEQCVIKIQKQPIFLNHYPMRYWDGSFRGSWHLYGHVHGRLAAEDRAENWRLARDVGVDACNYRPIGFEEIAEYMNQRVAAFEARRDQGLMN